MLHELGQTCRLLFIKYLTICFEKCARVVMESQDTPGSILMLEVKIPQLIHRWPHCAPELAVFGLSEGHARQSLFIRQVTTMYLRALGALLASSSHGVEETQWPEGIHVVQQMLRQL
jgi:hypothetical protein